MDDKGNKLYKSALITAAGLGLLVVIAAKRKQILRYFKRTNLIKQKRIEVVQTVNDCERVVEQLQKHCEKLKVLGFDCEWVTVGGTRRPVALLQLSSGDGLCALFRLCCIKYVPKNLKDLLEDENIVKVGVAPHGDAQNLAYDYGVCVASTFDLRFLAGLVGEKPGGLAKMAKSILDIKLDKHWRLVCSDWEAKVLNEKQIEYAANDAWVAVQIFKKLYNNLHSKRFWTSYNIYEDIRYKLEPFYDVCFKETLMGNFNMANENKSTHQISKNKQIYTKKPYVRGISTISKNLYDNCLLEAPDGELLCTIDRRKAKWYLDQDLGNEVRSDPLTVRLNFEPAGRAVGEAGKYYQTPKENQCVVCGQRESFLRKNVIPREYRKHFPDVMKSHTSHDILLLCPRCHQLSNISDLKVRRKLSIMCNAPLTHLEGGYKWKEIPELREVKSAARALIKNSGQIPEARKKHLEFVLLKHYKEDSEISYELLLEASEIDTKEYNENFFQHGEKVVKKFQTECGGLLQLEKIWREHFITTMHPKYLPSFWNINHNAKRLAHPSIEF